MKAIAALVLIARIASAQAPSDADRLFEEGRVLLAENKYAEACAKFEQSIVKDPRAIGTLMNLGLCNERAGKVATALKLFREALDRASEAKLERATQQAKEEIAKLEPTVPHVAVTRAAAALPGEKLVIDDQVIALDQTDLTLDPGPHAVVLTAPDHLPYQTTIAIAPAARHTLALPALRVPENKVVTRTTSPRRAIGKVTTIAGLGVAAVGGALVVYAKHDYDSLFSGATPHCGMYPPIDGKATCDATGQSRSQRDANISTAGWIAGSVGLAAAATGLLLWLTAPTETEHTTVTPLAGGSTVGLVLTHSF